MRATVLLTVDDYEDMTKRAVPDRVGRPLVAVDLGGSRAWSAALALWPNGRIECPGGRAGAAFYRGSRAKGSGCAWDVPGARRCRDVLVQAPGLRVPTAEGSWLT